MGKVLGWDVGDVGLLLDLGRSLLHLGRIRKGVFAFPCVVRGEQDVLVESAETWWSGLSYGERAVQPSVYKACVCSKSVLCTWKR